jgi:hypothetical protein
LKNTIRATSKRFAPSGVSGFLLGRLKQYSLGTSTYDPAEHELPLLTVDGKMHAPAGVRGLKVIW